ncbi:MAG TPA: hypothetical protein VM364_15190 [Vicinamibacterales bacterium]|nr:hypothetical protein [Vicinamibacterales bacterium]
MQFAVWSKRNTPVRLAPARLRNVTTAQIQAVVETSESGQGQFRQIPPGTYVIEVTDRKGKVVAIGQVFTLGDGETIASFVRFR